MNKKKISKLNIKNLSENKIKREKIEWKNNEWEKEANKEKKIWKTILKIENFFCKQQKKINWMTQFYSWNRIIRNFFPQVKV